MAEDVPLECEGLGKCCSTVSLLAGEGSKTQMNVIHMPLQSLVTREIKATCDALVGLLLQMDSFEVALHAASLSENLVA